MTTTSPDLPPLLQLERLGRRRAGRDAVQDLSLALRAGEVLGLLGVNGAGKSTTLSMIAGALRPDSGSLHLDGRDVLDLDCPPGAERFDRILEIVSGHEADIQAARRRWALYQQAGHDVRGHRLPADHPAGGNHRGA